VSNDWTTKTLGEVSNISYGYTQSASREKVGPRFLRITDIQNDRVDWEAVPFCEIAKADLPKYRLATGDIVFARTGATTGKSFLLNEPPESVFASYLIRLRLHNKDLMPEFVSLFFQSDDYWRTVESGSVGSAQGGFNATKLAALSLPVPPLPEQQRIVGVLDEAFEGISTAKANAEQNLRNARALFESHLQSVFSERREDWIETTIGDEVDLLSGFAFKSKQYTTSPQSVRLLRGDNIVQGVLRWDDVKRWPDSDTADFDRYQLRSGDIVIAMDRPWVKAGLKHAMISDEDLPCLLVQRTARIRTRSKLDDRFLLSRIGASDFTAHVLGKLTGVGVPHISGQQIKDFSFLRPPIEEQRSISDTLDGLRSETARLESIYRQKLDALDALKKSLLHKAFSGQL